MNTVDSFADQIFSYIKRQYGEQTLSNVKSTKHNSIVTKLIESSAINNSNIEHAANKIIAMLRMNP